MTTLVPTPIDTAAELIELVRRVGFLPLLACGIEGFSADEAVADDCRYVTFPEGGWDWPMWKWKGPVVTEGGYAYGKFFAGKAGFVSPEWWPDLCNYRRATRPEPADDSVEAIILATLREQGPLVTRHLRAACGFTEPKMRSRFDAYVTRLEMDCRIVTQDFVYPRDRHNRAYGWGWSLLTTPEQLFGAEACHAERSPEESLARILAHLGSLLPHATEAQLRRIIQ